MRNNVPEIRYDLTSDIATLDMTSQIALLDLGQKWAEQNDELFHARMSAELDHEPFELAPYAELDEWPALTNTCNLTARTIKIGCAS